MRVLVLHKMCPRCGVVFKVDNDPVYCSKRCEERFKISNLDALKAKSSPTLGKYRPAETKQLPSFRAVPRELRTS